MKKTLALISATVISSLALVACGSEEDTSPEQETATETTTSVEETTSDQTDTDTDTEETPTADQDSEAEQIETADGNTVIVPSEFAAAISEQEAEWGAPLLVRSEGENFLAEFGEDHWLTFNAEAGAQPLVGMIAHTWLEEGGLNAEIGLPVEAEVEGENGWSQAFQGGAISWIRGGDGQFEALVSTEG